MMTMGELFVPTPTISLLHGEPGGVILLPPSGLPH